MKIAFYSIAWFTGGMENAVYNLGKLLYADGNEVMIIYKGKSDKTTLMMNKLSKYFTLYEYKDDIIECDLLINCDRKDFELPNVKTSRTIHWFSSCLIMNIDKIQGKVVSQSKWHYDQLKLLGIENTIIGNPLDVDNIINKSHDKVNKWREDNEIAYLVVSRISHEKGFDRIIKFMFTHMRENCKLYIVGDVTMDRNNGIRDKVQKSLRRKVVFLGEKDNPYPYIAQCDYLLCLSDNEIYGLVSEEAHILGKQVIFNRYTSAYDQFIAGFDMWYDKPISKVEIGIETNYIELNKERYRKWKEIIYEN